MNLEKEVFELEISDILPNRFQPREIFDEESINELAQSIKEHGVIQPIIVRKIGDKYEIVAGERRFRASQVAGKTTIPALIRNIDDKESAKVALLENLQRKNLTAIEEAKTYQTILKLDNLTQEELAKDLGKSQSAIANKLRLLNLDEDVQNALLNGQISERHARSLLNLVDKNKQKEMVERVILNRMTVKQLDEEIAMITGKKVIEDTEVVVPNLEEVKENNQIKFDTKDFNIPVMTEVEEKNKEIVLPPVPDTDSFETEIPQIKIPSLYENQPTIPVIEEEQEEVSSPVTESINFINDFMRQYQQSEKEEIEENKVEPIIEEKVAEQPLDEETEVIQEEIETKENLFASIDNLTKPLSLDIEQEVEETPVVEQEEAEEEQPNDIYDLRFAINNFRQAVQNTEKFGFNVETEEFDFNNVYQIVIKIDKNKQ